MKKNFPCIFFLVLLICHASIYAQTDTLRVDDFHFDPSYSIKARTASVVDGNNAPCALVVLRMAVPNARIEGSYVVKVEKQDNEYFIWIAKDASYIIIKTPDYLPLEYNFPEPIKSKSAYVMTVRKPEVNIIINNINVQEPRRIKTYNSNNTLAFFESAILPGLGQWGKGYAGHGILNMLGEAALVGGAIYFYNSAQKYNSEISSVGTVDAEIVNQYNSSVTTYRIFIGAAAVLYVFNLFQAVKIEPRETEYALAPTLMPFNNTFAAGLEFTFNF